jgi:glyoxylase-like metal-dependent hydrolase (beta-lactamase superfamily II)
VITDLGGGVYRVTHPLPFALDHVHCYAIDDGEAGWTIVDAGLGTPETSQRWREALDRLRARWITRLVLTHHHPDHLGASAALAELTGAEVIQGVLDAALTRRVWGPPRDLTVLERYLHEQGMPAELASQALSDEISIAVRAAEPTHPVDEGDHLELAGERFRVLVLPGHADGHIALLGERSGRLFGGDVLLAGITPNIGRWSWGSEDPLSAYLRTLDRLIELAPAIVYPGHREVIDDPSRRAAEIKEHHRVRLDLHHLALCEGAATPYEVSFRVWNELSVHQRRFALAEAAAHLARLGREGRAVEVEPGRWRPVSQSDPASRPNDG